MEAPPQVSKLAPSAGGAAWYGLAPAMGVFLLTRALVLVVALTAPQDRHRPNAPTYWSHVPLVRWDGGHYHYILTSGYPPTINDTVAFFPAYPLLCRPFAWLLGPDLALIVVSHLAALVAVGFFYAWAARRVGPRCAFWGVVLFSAYPPAMFLSTSYSDATLLACVASTLWLLDRNRLWAAAVISAVAVATRPTGIVLAAVVVLWSLVHAGQLPWSRRLGRAVLIGLITISGLVAFQLHLWHQYGRPDAFFAAQSGWEQTPVDDPVFRVLTLKPVLQPALQPLKFALRGPFRALGGDLADLRRLLEPADWNPFFNVTLVVLGIIGLIRPGPIPRLVFLLPILVFLEAYVAEPFRGGRLVGIARYQLMAFPSFLLLAQVLLRIPASAVRYVVIAGALFLQCIYTRGFVNWILVG